MQLMNQALGRLVRLLSCPREFRRRDQPAQGDRAADDRDGARDRPTVFPGPSARGRRVEAGQGDLFHLPSGLGAPEDAADAMT